MTILSKKQMSEEDIKLNYITPALLSGWSDHITMETKITDGKINLRGNMAVRGTPKRADYIFYLNDCKPILKLNNLSERRAVYAAGRKGSCQNRQTVK